jgi:ABC-type molybdate transport system permease subunit
MTRLCQDIRTHRRTALQFLLFWLAVCAVTAVTSHPDIRPPFAVLLLIMPVFAAALVAWWRGSETDGAVSIARQIAGGTLAALLVIEADVMLLFGSVLLHDLSRHRPLGRNVDEWIEWSIGFGAIGIVLGVAGAALGVAMERSQR